MRVPAPAIKRSGVAAVELALLLPLLLLFLMGIWEVGRMVEVQQILTNACREGGRQASTGVKTIAQVQADVVNYLTRNGITSVKTSDVIVENITAPSRAEPSTAEQLDRFRVMVSVSVDSVRWTLLSRITNGANLTASVEWLSMRDIPITVSDAIPLE